MGWVVVQEWEWAAPDMVWAVQATVPAALVMVAAAGKPVQSRMRKYN